LDYYKFRGRGSGALESHLGAPTDPASATRLRLPAPSPSLPDHENAPEPHGHGWARAEEPLQATAKEGGTISLSSHTGSDRLARLSGRGDNRAGAASLRRATMIPGTLDHDLAD